EASQRAEGRSLSLGPAPNPIRLAELAKHLAGARAWRGRRSPVHAISRGMTPGCVSFLQRNQKGEREKSQKKEKLFCPVRQLLRMRLFHVGNAVPDDPPRSIALTLELRNEVRLMAHQHTRTTVDFIVGATVECQVPATRNVYSLVDETHSPQRVVGKAHLEALSISFDPDS